MEQANPPVQIRLEGLPTSSNFAMVPRHNPSLSKHIEGVTWRAVDKTLHLIVQETAKLDVFKWLDYLRNRQKEIQEGPFVDLDEDALILCIKDGAGHSLGCLKFISLSLESHTCAFHVGATGGLMHTLAIQYQEVKNIPVKDEPTNAQEAVDEEWQQV